jgi:hypothetical protein
VFLAAFIPIVGAAFSGAVAVLVAPVTRGPMVALVELNTGIRQLLYRRAEPPPEAVVIRAEPTS